MKLTTLLAVASIGLTAVASAQTVQTEQTETKVVTINGEVVSYEPGRTIVVRQPDQKVVTYTLAPNVTVPADVKVGRTVTLYTEPGADGSTTVSRVVSTSVTPDGRVKRTTEETRTSPSGATSRTTTTEISGKVEAYESGKTLTIVKADGSKTTYVLTGESHVPGDLTIGKTVTVVIAGTPDEPVAKTVTYTIQK